MDSGAGAAPPTMAHAGNARNRAANAVGRNFIAQAIARAGAIAKHDMRNGAWTWAGADIRRVLAGFRKTLMLEGTMIEAGIWDFGGVLTTSPFEAFARFERERGLPVDVIRRTNAANHLENAWAKFERAEVDIETFDRLFAEESKALGAEVRGRDVLPLLQGDLRPEMVEALKRIKAKCKTGCITNNLPANAMGSTSGRSLYVAEVMVLFDHVIESAKMGLRKPDPRIYAMMTDALKVDPAKCVYLDDLGVNLKPAREMGMTTIKVVSAPQALAELEAATGMALR